MKTLQLALLLLLAVTASAQDTFPGLKAILTEAEWKRAGLDQLSPDQIGVIDAALIRNQARLTAKQQTEFAAVRQAAPVAAAPAVATPPPAPSPSQVQRFGLPSFDVADWRTEPPLKAKVTKWEGGNRFRLDNGQIWEGFNPISYDLPGKEIEIHARPHDQYTLYVEGKNTTVRVMRLR